MIVFPENITIDVHDLATVLLRERQLTEPLFKNARLVEVIDGPNQPNIFPLEDYCPTWGELPEHRRTAFNVLHESEDFVELTDFKHPQCICPRDISEKELETIYWCAKLYNSGYLLANVLRNIISDLPLTTKLRIRTSQGYEMICGKTDCVFNETAVLPDKIRFIGDFIPSPSNTQFKVGVHIICQKFYALPWAFAVFGTRTDNATNECVVLDLVTPLLGGRGLGGEVFSMERMEDYHGKILDKCCKSSKSSEIDPYIFLGVSPEETIQLKRRVIERLERIISGNESFCAYCGKSNAHSVCTACKGPKYCGKICQKKAWKYHKVWCKVDANARKEVRIFRLDPDNLTLIFVHRCPLTEFV